MSTHISPENMITFLVTTPMFEDLEPGEVSELTRIMEVHLIGAGDYLFREGDAGEAWYVLYQGEVEVLKESEGHENTIKTLRPGSCFGEIAILDGLPRSASIRAARDSIVLCVPKDEFNALLEKDDLIAYKLIRQMALALAKGQRTNTGSLSDLMLAGELAQVQAGISRIIGNSSVRE